MELTGFDLKVDACINDIRDRLNNSENSNCAYCCLLYGSRPSDSLVANAIVLGRSLSERKYPLILMVTPDVPESVQSDLLTEMKPDKIICVEYIYGDWGLYKRDWFREVFTKFHMFNLCFFSKVMFLDLDIMINNMKEMDNLFHLNCLFAAMENSKGPDALLLAHGESMSECGLINAGVMLITPDSTLFDLLVYDVTHPSINHVPGTTPEQYYLARILGRYFHNLSQIYNFEVQYHGGVPLKDIWLNTDNVSDIVAFHFSGGDPLNGTNMKGCQFEKYYATKFWNECIDFKVKKRATKRAEYAFNKWNSFWGKQMQIIETLLRSHPLY